MQKQGSLSQRQTERLELGSEILARMSFLVRLSFIPHSLSTLQKGSVFSLLFLNRSYLQKQDLYRFWSFFSFPSELSKRSQAIGRGLQVPTGGSLKSVETDFFFSLSAIHFAALLSYIPWQALYSPTPGYSLELRIDESRQLAFYALLMLLFSFTRSTSTSTLLQVGAPGKLYFLLACSISSKIVCLRVGGLRVQVLDLGMISLGSQLHGPGSLAYFFWTSSMKDIFLTSGLFFLESLSLEVSRSLCSFILAGSQYLLSTWYPSTPSPLRWLRWVYIYRIELISYIIYQMHCFYDILSSPFYINYIQIYIF